VLKYEKGMDKLYSDLILAHKVPLLLFSPIGLSSFEVWFSSSNSKTRYNFLLKVLEDPNYYLQSDSIFAAMVSKHLRNYTDMHNPEEALRIKEVCRDFLYKLMDQQSDNPEDIRDLYWRYMRHYIIFTKEEPELKIVQFFMDNWHGKLQYVLNHMYLVKYMIEFLYKGAEQDQ
jgi:hypothetical protein